MENLTDEQKLLIYKIYILGLRTLKTGKSNKNNKSNYDIGLDILPKFIKQLDK